MVKFTQKKIKLRLQWGVMLNSLGWQKWKRVTLLIATKLGGRSFHTLLMELWITVGLFGSILAASMKNKKIYVYSF